MDLLGSIRREQLYDILRALAHARPDLIEAFNLVAMGYGLTNADWRGRLAATDDERSAASLRAHITRAERDIAALEARIRTMQAALERGRRR